MHLQHHRHPGPGAQFFGTEAAAQSLGQHLSGGARDRPQTSPLQALQHDLELQPIPLGKEQQLLGGEGVQVDAGRSLLQGLEQLLRIGEMAPVHAGEGVESALDTQFGGPGGLGLAGSRLQLRCGEPVGAWLIGVAAEGAERTALNADVGGIEIAVHHVGDRVPHQAAAQAVGPAAQQLEIGALPGVLQQGKGQPGIRLGRRLQRHDPVQQLVGSELPVGNGQLVSGGTDQQLPRFTPGPVGQWGLNGCCAHLLRPVRDEVSALARRRRSRHSTAER